MNGASVDDTIAKLRNNDVTSKNRRFHLKAHPTTIQQ